jgi:predicted transcriptional regulator
MKDKIKRTDERKHRFSAENSATTRGLVVLKLLIDQPQQHTRKELANKFDVHIDTMKKYFVSMKKAGFEVVQNGYPDYCYYVKNVELKYIKN